MELSPHYDEADPFADSTKFVCIFDGNEINQTPHIKQTGAVTSVGIPCEPFMYNFNKFDHNNPAHWRNIAAEVVFRGIHEYTKRIFLGFDPIKTATPSEKNDPWEVYSKPCLICEDLLTAMYFYFYLRVTSPHNERICRKCATTFKPLSHKEKYCFDCRYDLINGTQIKKYPSQNLWNNTHRNKKGESSK